MALDKKALKADYRENHLTVTIGIANFSTCATSAMLDVCI